MSARGAKLHRSLLAGGSAYRGIPAAGRFYTGGKYNRRAGLGNALPSSGEALRGVGLRMIAARS